MDDSQQLFLRVNGLVAGYGNKQVLNGVSLEVARGEIVALVGHNGAGKSTLLKVLFGLIRKWAGEVTIEGHRLCSSPHDLLRAGIAYVPQGNRVFPNLTVRENLELSAAEFLKGAKLRQQIDRALTFFPPLTPRLHQKAGNLSGGEKQMLALAGLLTLSPRLLLLDEPSLGLAPPLVPQSLARLQQISRESSAAILVVDQRVREVLKIARRVYVLRNGLVSFTSATSTLDDAKLTQAFF